MFVETLNKYFQKRPTFLKEIKESIKILKYQFKTFFISIVIF